MRPIFILRSLCLETAHTVAQSDFDDILGNSVSTAKTAQIFTISSHSATAEPLSRQAGLRTELGALVPRTENSCHGPRAWARVIIMSYVILETELSLHSELVFTSHELNDKPSE